MIIGVPKEIKNHEYRVGLTPASVRELTLHGHQVVIEQGAGLGSGFPDALYQQAGAEILPSVTQLYAQADMIVKVKEPQPEECKLLRSGQIIFTYLHLAPDPVQAELLQQSGCIAIAYETVTDRSGRLPLLAPMSTVAGRMSIQAGAHCLEKTVGGPGILLGGVPGVAPAEVLVLGGGVAGANAIRMAVGMEARVVVLDKSVERLRELDDLFGARLTTVYSTRDAVEHYINSADLVIGAVLVPGAAAPKLITREMLQHMRRGAVIVDIAIDQGGCAETSRATTHVDPTYVVDGIVHYCVTNMPGAVARTSTLALNNVTLPFVLKLADLGYREALMQDPNLLAGLNVCSGAITYEAVAKALAKPYVAPLSVL